VKALFQAAVERPADERQAFLAAATGDDETLRHEVESLLASDTSEAGFLNRLPVASESVMADLVPPASTDRTWSRPGLAAGSRVGHYEIVAALGAGGMGEVLRARDTKLHREVALKVLPESFARDHDRLARFTREAQTLAALNHPNIAHIHGLEESSGVRALVMELVDGEDLSERLARGAISIAEALPIAKQIAHALEAAHDQGIIHRDLKPANIKLRRDGTVKVLDFGLAKMIEPRSSSAEDPTLANSPTITKAQAGMIIGTAAYMSPEQAKGLAADRRSDVWAFGVVLYEMLSGQRPFKGDVASDTLAAVLTRQPDWTALPATTPPQIGRLLRRSLEKDRARRLADIADARLEIDDALSGSNTDAPEALPSSRTNERLAWSATLLLVALTAAGMVWWAGRSASVAPETTRTIVSVAPTGQSPSANPLEQRVGGARPTRTALALSPDGKTLVFGAIWGGDEQLYARAMDRLDAMPLVGTIGGSSPFFSPDGQWVGFWAGGKLRKVPLAGGPAVTLCDAASIFGASWGSDGGIVFATARNGGLWRVPAAGGTPEALTTLQPGEYSHRLPHVLPGGRAVIFTISKGAQLWDDTQIVVRSLETGKQTVLVTGGSDGHFVSTGHLIYVRLGTLMAVPFDPVRLAVIGGATGVIDDVMQAANRNLSDMENTLSGQFAVSESGALVYLTGGVVSAAERSLAWVDRLGRSQPLSTPLRSYRRPRLSPDHQRVAVSTEDRREVWSYDVVRGALSPVTADGQSGYGIFSPDGKRVVFRSGAAGGEDNLYWKAADGSGVAERLTTSARSQTPASWSPDGTTLAFVEEGDSTGFFQFDIRVLSMANRKTSAVIQTTANEMSPEFSPNGQWLAYVSNQSGRHEVYVQPYPGPGERHLISTNGGGQPAWSWDGRELFYVQGMFGSGPTALTLMSVSVETISAFRAGTPETLFESADLRCAWGRCYDVARDGRFLMTLNKEPAKNPAPAQMIFVQNWFEELKRLVPAK
jgi:serine/threonine-protein kinase